MTGDTDIEEIQTGGYCVTPVVSMDIYHQWVLNALSVLTEQQKEVQFEALAWRSPRMPSKEKILVDIDTDCTFVHEQWIPHTTYAG